LSVSQKRSLIELNHPKLSIEEQCSAINLSRSSYYYEPIGETEENLKLMKRIEEIHLQIPELGYRKIFIELRKEDWNVNEKRIERLWSLLRFRSILPGPNLSKPEIKNVHYPYLLNGLWVDKPYLVFSADITYIPVKNGFIYLVSITDWFSRNIMSWETSNTLSVGFCITALEKALEKGIPVYFNTDQGSQFTCTAFIDILKKHSIKISMDGKGRCIDNIYQERGWWSLKYERIYPGCLETVPEVIKTINEYYSYFNCKRSHQALLYATPYEILHGLTPKFSKGKYVGFKVKEASGKKKR
jgi:putative transposase